MFCIVIAAKSDKMKDNIIIALSVVVAVLLIAMATMAICFIRRMEKTTQGILYDSFVQSFFVLDY